MTKDVVTVDVDATVKTAVDVMNHYEIGCLIVVKDGGVWEPLVVVSPHMKLEEATRIMLRRNIKKLPVVKDDRLVGIVTLTDSTVLLVLNHR